jgi:hypothetical protein
LLAFPGLLLRPGPFAGSQDPAATTLQSSSSLVRVRRRPCRPTPDGNPGGAAKIRLTHHRAHVRRHYHQPPNRWRPRSTRRRILASELARPCLGAGPGPRLRLRRFLTHAAVLLPRSFPPLSVLPASTPVCCRRSICTNAQRNMERNRCSGTSLDSFRFPLHMPRTADVLAGAAEGAIDSARRRPNPSPFFSRLVPASAAHARLEFCAFCCALGG